MPIVLYLLGLASTLLGLAAVAMGIPVKEFSFGNTLIIAGTTATVGGLMVIGLGAAVGQLQRVVEMLGARPIPRPGRPMEAFESGAASRAPFPPRPKPAVPPPMRSAEVDASGPGPAGSGPGAPFLAPPTLPNPASDLAQQEIQPPAAVEPDPEMPQFPVPPKARPRTSDQVSADTAEPVTEPDLGEASAAEPAPGSRQEAFLPPWLSGDSRAGTGDDAFGGRAERPSFEDMWPSSPRRDAPLEPDISRAETVPRVAADTTGPDSEPDLPPLDAGAMLGPDQEAAAGGVPVLKSGVVDGMGYTLYVDGSIEAELPDGTLRFASINELRAHLERNS